MKTYAHLDIKGFVCGIGMIYDVDTGRLAEVVQPFVDELGEDAGITAYGLHVIAVDDTDAVTAITIDTDELTDGQNGNYNKTFLRAMKHNNGAVAIDLPKAKLIAHDKRRAKRAAELAPLDIEATIPAKANQAEAARQAIRDKHATLQTQIDAATTEAALKQLLVDAGAL